jgi:aspartyl-tRNA(Asn)/glutamyl-tRNA(Gln) amidotransferase subunit C
MALSPEQVRHVARLARLALSEEEQARFAGELSAILAHVEQLQAVDVSTVLPMTHAALQSAPLRADELAPSLGVTAALQNAPDRSGSEFRVPAIIE